MKIEKKLKALKINLPEPITPLASYVPVTRTGNLLFVSGQLPIVDGKLKSTGKVGSKLGIPQSQELAKICAINCLAAIKGEIGDLDKVTKIVKVVGFVNSFTGFTKQPLIINGASDFLIEVFGDAGKHARSAVGVRELPRDAPIEIEMIVEVSD